jgi:hypothetical protein
MYVVYQQCRLWMYSQKKIKLFSAHVHFSEVANVFQSIRGNTPILCENRRPEVAKKLKWPYLKCCDSGDLCNSAVMATPPAWVSTISSQHSAVKQRKLNLT